MTKQTTICALSTAPGVGGIAVIRVSGPEAFSMVGQLTNKTFTSNDSHKAVFSKFFASNGQLIDEVVCTIFAEGKSFTGENTVEIACHGSRYIQQYIIQQLIEGGCVLAAPGEFTMRAFMNGRMDLSQAEAVADLIASESSRAHEVALNQMRGSFSSELRDLREKLIHFASLVELELDFAEEDVEFADRSELLALVNQVLAVIKRLIRSFELGNVLKNGVPVSIVGAPNAGKSTLLNQLLGEDRAIVSNIAGTTRDVIEETLNIEGILFRLIDTAGIRDNAGEIEALGIERSLEKIKQAKVVLLLADSGAEKSKDEGHLSMSVADTLTWAEELKATYPTKHFLVLANKGDLNQQQLGEMKDAGSVSMLSISAKTGEGVQTLKNWLVSTILQDYNSAEETIITNARHVEALQRTNFSLEKAKDGLETNVTGDFVAMDIRQAMFELGSITGDISTEDLLGNIFSKFCIGK